MSLFVLSCKDGWVNIMYDGLDAVGVDQQVCFWRVVLINKQKKIQLFFCVEYLKGHSFCSLPCH